MNAQELVTTIVEQLQQIKGIEGVVLGGSRARGTHTPQSDIDLGLYYRASDPLDLNALRQLAMELDDSHRHDVITDFGEWGPWINGGGWLKIQGMAVDFLYREVEKVSSIIASCCAGEVQIAYQPGHPHAFLSSVYMAEIALCHILWDPYGTLAQLKSQTVPYPLALKQALMERFFWEAGFSLSIASKGISRNDVSYVAGCCFRCISCLMQTLFALNERYWMNEKGAVALAQAFPLCPMQLEARINEVFAHLAPETARLASAVQLLEELVDETEGLLVPQK
jgi:predicted nucleotidyltransferase